MTKLSTLGLAVALSLGAASAAKADVLLNINLSVPNQFTITALPGLSAVSASGSTTTGFYFQNFFGSSATFTTAATTVGPATLTAASVPSDGSPTLFRFNATEPGLNVWSYSATATTTFAAGAVAFSGSATWNVPAAIYAAALAGSLGGNVYFPADDLTDLPGAQILGTYTVTTAAVPEPATAALLGLGAVGLLLARRRRQDVE